MKPAHHAIAAMVALLALTSTRPAAAAPTTDILFVGNSYTHGRYDPALNYNAGAASNPSNDVVHDLLCPGTGTTCSSGVRPCPPSCPPPPTHPEAH